MQNPCKKLRKKNHARTATSPRFLAKSLRPSVIASLHGSASDVALLSSAWGRRGDKDHSSTRHHHATKHFSPLSTPRWPCRFRVNCSKKKKKKNTHTLTRHKIFGTRGYSSARDVRRPFIGTRVITPPEIRLLQLFPRHKILAIDGGHSSARHHCFGAVLCGLNAQISWQR